MLKLQMGINLGPPLSRPMPDVYPGSHELRIRDESRIYRLFYYANSSSPILLFHAFVKKTQKTPPADMKTGRRRLKEMLCHENKS